MGGRVTAVPEPRKLGVLHDVIPCVPDGVRREGNMEEKWEEGERKEEEEEGMAEEEEEEEGVYQ